MKTEILMSSQSMSPAASNAITWGTPVSLMAGAALSFQAQTSLAVEIGYSPKVAWLLPAAVVVAETVATIVQFGTPKVSSKKIRSVDIISLAVVGISMALNATYHWLHQTEGPIGVTLVVSAIPNLVVALMLHLASARNTGTPEQVAEVEEVVPEPVPGVTPPPERNRESVVPAGVALLPLVPLGGSDGGTGTTEQRKASARGDLDREQKVPQVKRASRAVPAKRSESSGDKPEQKRTVPAHLVRKAYDYIDRAGLDVEKVSGTDLVPGLGMSDRYCRMVLAALRSELTPA